MGKKTIKYHNIFNQIPQCRYGNNIGGMTISAFTKYLHNEIFDEDTMTK